MARFRSTTRANVWRLQASFNRKVERLKRNSSTKTNLIPQKITNEEIINMINNTATSRDLQREIKKMERFIKRGGEKVITYEGEEMLKSDKETLISLKRSALGRLRSEVNLELAKIGSPTTYKKLMENPRIAHFYGQEVGNTIAKIQKIRTSGSMGKSAKQRMYEKYTADGDKWLRFRNNFIEMIKDTGYLYGIPEAEIKSVTDKLKKLSGRNFAVAYRKNKWIDQLIYGYHIFVEFELSDNFSNEERTNSYFEDWQEFKDSIDIMVNEELLNEVNLRYE